MAKELKLQLLQEDGQKGHAHECGTESCNCGSHTSKLGQEPKIENITASKTENIVETKAKAKTLKVVLCTTPLDIQLDRGFGEYPRMPKVAIMSIYQFLEEAGYAPDYYDIDTLLPSDNEMFEYFKSSQPEVAGISAVVSSAYASVKKITKIIREASPNTLIVLGGYMGASANILLRKTNVDLVVLGDGENPLVSLCDYLEDNGKKINKKELLKIRGLAFLDEDGEMELTGYADTKLKNANYLPNYDIHAKGCLGNYELMEKAFFRETKDCPDFNHDPKAFEPDRNPKMVSLLSTKGCVARCTFCQRFSRGYFVGNIEAMDTYLRDVKEKYNVGAVLVADENFGSDQNFAYALAGLMKKHGLIWFAGGVRVTSVKPEDIQYYKDHGCVMIRFGVESGCQKILDVMEKKITVKNLMNAFTASRNAGLYPGLGFCLGMPGETNETIMESGRFIAEVALMYGVPPQNIFTGFPYAMPFPGTPLYQYGQLQGVIGTSVDDEEKYLLHVSDIYPVKENYINLSGSSMKDAIFWNFLARYEAMRHYYNNPLSKETVKGKKRETTVKAAISQLTFKNFLRHLFNPITTLNAILICSPLVAKISGPWFYSLMRNLLWTEYKIKNLFRKKKDFCPDKVELPKDIDISKGLRHIVEKLKEARTGTQTKTDKNVDILLLGR